MDALVDLNKSPQGLENEVLAYNTLCHEDAIRAIAMLKAKMAGEAIQAAPRTWDPAVKTRNLRLIERVTGGGMADTASEACGTPATPAEPPTA